MKNAALLVAINIKAIPSGGRALEAVQVAGISVKTELTSVRPDQPNSKFVSTMSGDLKKRGIDRVSTFVILL